MRRSLGAVLWSLVGLLSCFLGAMAALVGTGPGHTLLARALAGTVDRIVAGRVEVGDVSGRLITGVTLRDVRLFDLDSTLVAWLPEVELAYNPFDFAAGRGVMQEVRLARPQFNLVQHPNGRLNLEDLLRLRQPDTAATPGARGPAPLILLRNVAISDGSLVLRLQDEVSPGDSLLEIDEFGPDGRRRVRRFDGLKLELAALRLSAPRMRGIRVEINRLAVVMSDPAVTVRDAAGVVTIVGDSIDLDLSKLALPGSQLALTGQVTWPRDTILYNLDVVADSATLGDLAWIDPRFGASGGARVRGAAAVRSSAGGDLLVRLDPIEVRHHGGRLAGKVTTVSEAGAGIVRVDDGDLTADNVDLELARPFLDTLPFAGRLTGRTVVAGPMAALGLDIDWWFRDSLVPGWPETRLMGRGAVDLTHLDGIAFTPFTLDTASLDLRSAQRLVPALALRGTLDGSGTLEGPYSSARWTGTLRHHDGAAPASLVRGTFRLDARGETLGVSADVTADTLALAGLRGSFPGLTLDIPLAGPIRLEGSIADLETHADLAALDGGGRVRVDGWLTLLAPPLGARDLTVVATDVDLRTWLGGGAPGTRLTFTARGDVRADSGAPPVGALRLDLAPSLFAGAALDSGRAALRFADGRLLVDTLRLAQAGVLVSGSGALGWHAPHTGVLTLAIDGDALDGLDSIATWVAGSPVSTGDSVTPLQGSAEVRATLTGSLDSLAVDARAGVRGLRWRDWAVPAGSARAQWDGAVRQFALDVAVDSLARGDLGFGAAAVRAAGRADSLSWFARSRVGEWLAFLAGGSLTRRPALTTVHVDSAAALLPGEVWLLDRSGDVRLTDAAVTLADSGLVWRRGGDTTGRVTLSGGVAREGAGNARLTARGFPLSALAALVLKDTTGARGRVDADLALGGTPRAPTIDASFVVTGATGSTPLLATGAATYRDRRLDGRLDVRRGERRILDVTAHLPIDLSLAAVPNRQVPDTLWVRAVADSVDLAQLGLLDAFASGATGRVSADVAVRGRWDTPTLAGYAAIHGGAATISSLNVRYEDLNGAFSFSGDTIRVDSLGLRSGTGRLAVGGYVRLEQLTRPVLALDLDARDFRALEVRNYMTVTASGQVALRGPVFGATLTGSGTVTSSVLYFADLVTKRVVNLDEPWVATLITPEELRRQDIDRGFHNRFLDSLRIRDLTLGMGTDVWLRSNEANIQLTGSVQVSKEARNYVLVGTLQAPRGTYRLVVGPVTREFVVTDGTVRYFGTSDLNAELNITARHVVRSSGRAEEQPQDIPITAHIGGTLLVPRLRLSVEGQQLSQTEIVSYLIFGRQTFELGQAGQGSRERDLVVSTMASVLTGELERTLVSDLGVPLDYIEIRPGDPDRLYSGALLAAGWQIGERTFLTLNAGFCENQRVSLAKTLGATLQFRISPEWRTEASFEPVRSCNTTSTLERQLGLDLLWERRY